MIIHILCNIMGSRIPKDIKLSVLRDWLYGLPRDVIARNFGIAGGSISRIIDSWRSTDVVDIDLLREIAVMIRKNGLKLDDVASGIRIKNYLEQMGSSEEEIEKLLEEIDIHSFKTNQTFHDFVMKIHEIHKFASMLGISIHEVPDYVNQKKGEIQTMENEIRKLKTLILKKQIEVHS